MYLNRVSPLVPQNFILFMQKKFQAATVMAWVRIAK